MKKILLSIFVLSLLVPVSAFASFDTSLKYGSHGSAVTALQDFLQNQGVYSGKVDGWFGLGTLKAVETFQSTNGLQADGYFGKASRAKANNLLATILAPSNTAEQAETGIVTSTTLTQPTLDSRGCSTTSLFSSTTGQPCSITNTPTTQIYNTPISTSIDYSSFSKIQMAQYANNPSAYLGQKVEFMSSVVSFLPKGGSNTTNYISLLDPIANIQVMAEVDDSNAYANLANKVKAGDTFRVYGIGLASKNFTNTNGVTVSISVVQLSAADDCDAGSSVTNLTSDSSPYGWTCAGTMQPVMP